jgi:A/G-specific adenine glycosylase
VTEKELTEVRQALLQHFSEHRRRLPWRQDPNPYRILVSEIMLQQTTVDVVATRYQRFLQRFPTIEALAAARQEEVLHEWAGLGYYARARNLHKAAREIVEGRRGEYPRTAKEWKRMPGVGAYSAAAISSIAFGERLCSLDANVQRVLARLLAFGEDLSRSANRSALLKIGNAIADCEHPGDVNEALMELGATTCRAHDPKCWVCPLQDWCVAAQLNQALNFPVLAKQHKLKAINDVCIALVRDGRYLIVRRPARTLWAGMYEFPRVTRAAGESVLEAAIRAASEAGFRVGDPTLIDKLQYQVAGYNVTLHCLGATVEGFAGNGRGWLDSAWVTPTESADYALTAAQARLFAVISRNLSQQAAGIIQLDLF